MLSPGQPAPVFTAHSHSRPDFAFSSVGGRYVLLAFLPDDPVAREAAVARIAAAQRLFDDIHLTAFAVTADADYFASQSMRVGLRWFRDDDRAIARAYGALDPDGSGRFLWMLIDPSLRVMAWAYGHEAERIFGMLPILPPVDGHAGVPIHAPVLIVPRVFEPDICRRLIAHYEAEGGAPSGTMQEVDGKTVGVLSNFKNRRDANVDDPEFRKELRVRIERRLLPEIRKAFQFNVTRMERYIVACYDAEEGGYFNAHRDNTTRGTAHRKFACTINLNADEFDGGDLRFPEFGTRTYKAPTGGAVVFSCSLLHEATKVRRGKRYAFLPFFYDEDGARIRQANLQYLAGAEPQAQAAEAGSGQSAA